MTQDIKHMASSITQKKSANQELLELEASGEGSSLSRSYDEDMSFLREQLTAANNNIAFLQKEHGSMLKSLHSEIERLQDLCKDLQFRCEMADCLLPDSEFFRCSPKALEKKVEDLQQENVELRRKLSESLQAIDILDQKEKLALWQHHQELEQRDEAIAHLEKELHSKCATITQMTAMAQQGARRKKSNFWRRFSFSSSNAPSTSASCVPPQSKVIHPQRVEHLSKEDLPSEMQGNFPSYESQYQSYSSYSSLSDKSVSDDEGLGHRSSHHAGGPAEKLKDSASVGKSVKLPPIHGLQIRPQARQPLRCSSGKPSLAIDQIKSTDVPVKRTGKI